ncbi:hypothetical protein LTR36_008172 [Oleoguttula mirabilis]|uniref:Uncharacterized protein n=1 Tax=Oleoguttula mirabilis TaxID=1507867 RepID=A0AAV9J8B0_9PEZI|nr:hypothetical protein LTR36_008172 [Oleoguttula mirabilis]
MPALPSPLTDSYMATSPPVRPDIPVPADQSPLEYLKTRMDSPEASPSDQLTLADLLKDARFFSNAFSHAERVAALRYGYDKLVALAADVTTAEWQASSWEAYSNSDHAEREFAAARTARRKFILEYWKDMMGHWEREGKGETGDVEEMYAAVVLALVKDVKRLVERVEVLREERGL